jgi:FkbM family methyltransferase
MKIVPEDNRFIKEVIEDREYFFVFDYDVVVDVGANIGTFSIFIYNYAKEIFALEPIPNNFNYLIKNLIDNNLSKVKPYQIAIGGKSGKRKMLTNGLAEGEGGWSLDDKGELEVGCLSLADFMQQEKIEYIDLLKLDVEGAELEIVQAEDFPAKKIGTIIGEIHYGDDRATTFIKRLLQLGYNLQAYKRNHFKAKL